MTYQDWIASYVDVAGELEIIKERPWSFVVRIPAKDGVYWFKENRGDTRYEASLVHALARWVPGRVLEPVAIDAERSWSLLPDGGPTLREAKTGDWAQMLAAHAQLQRDLSVHSAQLISLRVPDQSPTAMAAWAAARGATPPPLPTLDEIPLTLQHDDLHDGNVFADGKVFDWGDASVSHPFGVLLVSLNVLKHQGADQAALLSARDAYLEPWSDLAPLAELREEASRAIELAKIGRAMSWARAMRDATAAQAAELGSDPVTGWLGELGKPSALSS